MLRVKGMSKYTDTVSILIKSLSDTICHLLKRQISNSVHHCPDSVGILLICLVFEPFMANCGALMGLPVKELGMKDPYDDFKKCVTKREVTMMKLVSITTDKSQGYVWI